MGVGTCGCMWEGSFDLLQWRWVRVVVGGVLQVGVGSVVREGSLDVLQL